MKPIIGNKPAKVGAYIIYLQAGAYNQISWKEFAVWDKKRWYREGEYKHEGEVIAYFPVPELDQDISEDSILDEHFNRKYAKKDTDFEEQMEMEEL